MMIPIYKKKINDVLLKASLFGPLCLIKCVIKGLVFFSSDDFCNHILF